MGNGSGLPRSQILYRLVEVDARVIQDDIAEGHIPGIRQYKGVSDYFSRIDKSSRTSRFFQIKHRSNFSLNSKGVTSGYCSVERIFTRYRCNINYLPSIQIGLGNGVCSREDLCSSRAHARNTRRCDRTQASKRIAHRNISQGHVSCILHLKGISDYLSRQYEGRLVRSFSYDHTRVRLHIKRIRSGGICQVWRSSRWSPGGGCVIDNCTCINIRLGH